MAKQGNSGFFVEQRGQRFRLQVRYKGVTIPSETFATRALAEQQGRRRVVEIDQGITSGGAPKATEKFADVVDRYIKTMYPMRKWSPSKDYGLGQLHKDLGHLSVGDLDADVVVDYAMKLSERMSPPAIKSRLYYLTEVVETARDLLKVKNAPVEAIRAGIATLLRQEIIAKGKPRKRKVKNDEIAKIKACVSTHALANIDLAAIIDVLSVLPIRVGELLKIEWADLDAEARTVKLIDRKTAKDEVEEIALPVIFGIDTFDLIANRPRHMAKPFPYAGADGASTPVSNAFFHARARAQVSDLHLHDLRAHGISMLLAADVSVPVVATISGHKDWKVMQQHYARLSPDQVRAAIERITGKATPPTAPVKLRLVEQVAA